MNAQRSDQARTAVLAHMELSDNLSLRLRDTGNSGPPPSGWSHVPDKGVIQP
jgi:hypothetical protein